MRSPNHNGKVEPMRNCPRFEKCSVPICPLDPFAEQRDRLSGEPSCTLAKTIRIRIAADSDLPRKGLTKLEWAARQRQNDLPEAERLRRTANLRPFERNTHASQQSRADGSVTHGNGRRS
jgi:hypothetical protein